MAHASSARDCRAFRRRRSCTVPPAPPASFGEFSTGTPRTFERSASASASAGDDAIARECNGCDILVHEGYSGTRFATIPPKRQPYHAQAHTSATHLGDVAARARPGLLVLSHQLWFSASDSTLLGEVRSRFRGRVVSARDLDRF